jgi:adenine-specific DNA methylase
MAVIVHPEPGGTVRFEPVEVGGDGKGPNGEDLDAGTVTRGQGQCVHCRQAIDGDEIKRQARGESEHGTWKDVLYCVAGIRLEPKLDKHGKVQRFASGARKGEVKTQKIRYFRAPTEVDRRALAEAEAELDRRRIEFEMKGLVPNEPFPEGNDMRPVKYGMPTWADMFTPRQLLGHLTAMETLQQLKPQILDELGPECGRAVVTYLQFMIDKCTDYNSRQTRWEYTRGIIKGGFGRHDFSLKWTFGEMVFSGPSSGLAWGVSQVLDAYAGIADLAAPRGKRGLADEDLRILQGSATEMTAVDSDSVDAIVMDPPYYDNVQYSELSDFYYVWQKRSLGDLYPGWFEEPVTDKQREAVANPARDGSAKSAYQRYLELMQDIFAECRRVLKDDGILTLMFTHKKQEAWETLTESLIRNGWNITGTYPVDSESGHSTHQMNMASAASTIFLACRPRDQQDQSPSSWSFEVKAKLERAVRDGLMEFEKLKLGPVDRMIAAWGRALRVYSEHWPVLDGDEEIPPTRAMQEAARVVAEEEVRRLSGGLVSVEDLDDESRLAMIALGINGLGEFAYDDALQLSKSLNFRLQQRNGNYRVSDGVVAHAGTDERQPAAPLIRKGSKLRLLKPEERLPERLDNPQTLWDALCGLIVTYRDGGVVASRNYLSQHGQAESSALRGLLKVWAKECRDEDLQKEARLIDYEL